MSSKTIFGPIKFWIYTFSYVKLYFNHDSGVILPKKMSLLTKNWPKWSKIAIFVIFWRFFGDNIPKFSKFSKKNVIFVFLTQIYVFKDSIYTWIRNRLKLSSKNPMNMYWMSFPKLNDVLCYSDVWYLIECN